MRYIRLLAYSFVVLVLAGCSTFATLSSSENPESFDCNGNQTITRVYSGVSNDLRFLRGAYPDKGLVVLDMPFSLIADSVVLPYTIYAQISHGNLCNASETLSNK